MRNNLVAEMVKRGYRADQVPKVIAAIIGCSERTVRNKIKNVTDFTVAEAMIISNKIFQDTLEFKYLFRSTDISQKEA